MSETKPATQFFTTVSDMRKLPIGKIDHFCQDLRLWLQMHAQMDTLRDALAEEGLADMLVITSPTEAFGWIDDGRHDAKITIDVREQAS